MSKRQINKNFQLSAKLADFLANKSETRTSKGVTFVVFSATDEELNKLNTKLLDQLKSQGEKVIKAKETGSKEKPWIFTPALV
jgi:hypothetical protein